MDLDKLKVAELRTELASRSLDTKGTKPVLLARLREAIRQSAPGSASPEPEVVEAEQVEAVEPEPAAPTASSGETEVEAAKDEEEEEEEEEAEEEVEAEAEAEDAEAEAEQEEEKDEATNAVESMDHTASTNGDTSTDEKKEDETMAVKTEEQKSTEKTEDETKKTQDKEDEGKAANNKQRRGQKRKMDDEPFVVTEDEPDIDESVTCLDWYNSDMNLKITKEDMMTAEPFWKDGWGYVWAGVRSTFGFTQGQVAFEVKLLEHMESKLENEKNLHELRVGFSSDEPSLQLGESKNSFCYSGSGKKGHDSVFEDFGATFAKEDVVGAYVEFADDKVKISFTKNGEAQGEAFEVAQSELEGKALFPHVSTRNVKFEVNFGQSLQGEDREPWKPIREGFAMAANVEDKIRGPPRIAKREDCEMLMMIGLPASGKTTWVRKHVEEHPEKRYSIIGTAALIEKMKVNGEPRKQHHEKDKWDALIQKCTRCLQDWLRVASQRRRNVVIDQTNVYANAQKRKVRPFEGMQRKAVVIVPSEEDYKARGDSQEKAECKDVPDTAVMEMKANFTVPAEGEDSPFKEIVFTDLQREEATKLVETYNKDAKEKGYGKKHEQRNKRFRGNFNKNRGGRVARGGGRGMPPGRMPPFFRGGMRGMPPRGFPMRPPMRGGMGGPMRGPPHRWGPLQGMPMGGPPRGGGNMPGPRGGGPRGGRGSMGPRGNMGGPRNNMGPRGGGGGHGGPQKYGGGGGGSAPWGNPAPWSQNQRPSVGPWGNGGGGGGPWSQGGGNQMGGGSPWGNQGGMNQQQPQRGMMGGYGSRPTNNVWGGNQGGGGNFNQGGFGGGGNNAWGSGFGGGYGGGYGR